MFNGSSKLNFRLRDIIRAAFGLAKVDGGFVIGIQIINFLLTYFGTNIQFNNEDGFVGITRTTLIVSLIGMLNLSVIIYRIAGLTRGMRYSPTSCYNQALRRWPILILLYILGSILLLAITQPLLYLLQGIAGMTLNYTKLLMFGMLILIPYGMLACIYVIDQQKNPIQAVIATFYNIKEKLSMRLLFNISMLYALPFSINSLLTGTIITPYLGLFNAVWFLFCHILVIVLYAGANVEIEYVEKHNEKKSKVIIA